MMKKRSLLLVALVLFSVSLFAAPVVVTWDWMLEDPNVTTFRYQVDGEDPNNWIVVDSSVTSYELAGLDDSQSYTLYLQQSYDGINFSKSAKNVASIVPLSEPESPVVSVETTVADKVDADKVDADKLEADKLEAEKAAADKAVADKLATEKTATADSRYKTTITLGVGAAVTHGSISSPALTLKDWSMMIELGSQFKNIKTFNENLGLGLDVGLAYTPYRSTSLVHTATISLAPMLNMQFEELGKFDLGVGVGGFVTFGPDFDSTKNKNHMAGMFAKLGVGYQINSQFSVGIDAKYNFVLSEANYAGFVDGKLYLGFSF